MFQKGESGNPAGRPAGAKGKVATQVRTTLENFMSDKVLELDDIWSELSAAEKLSFLAKMMDYILPKLRSQNISISDFESLSDQDLRRLAQEVINESQKAGSDEND